jgi:maleylacetate reductase
VLRVPGGVVPEAAAAVRPGVEDRPLVALGGGRVIDAAKAIGGADGLPVAALPTTLSGAELTRLHRMPAGVEEFSLVRPSLVIADPTLMASQPMPKLAASAMNALAHGVEALFTPFRNPVSELAGLEAAGLIAAALRPEEPDRETLALGSLLAAYALGAAGYAVHHVLSQTLVRTSGTPHAETNAVMLPHTAAFLATRDPETGGRLRESLPSEELARIAARSGATRLSELGEVDPEAVAGAALERSELGNTPGGPLGREELLALLRAAA